MSKIQNIDSVSKLLVWLSENRTNEFYKMYFRGESKDFGNTAFKPSIFRNNRWSFNETSMYNDVLTESPLSFEKDKTIFEKLVRMQHYGLPTRLLDITSNPLVALYFSCDIDSKSDGIFYTITTKKSNIKTQSDESVKFLSNVVLLGEFDDELTSRYGIKGFLKNREKYTQEYIRAVEEENESKTETIFPKLWKLTETEIFKFLNCGLSDDHKFEKLELFDKMIIVKAPKNNLRQSSQAGEFLMFGNNANLDNKVSKKNYLINKIVIPAYAKDKILQELDLINVNQYSLFPELSSLCEQIKLRYSNLRINYSDYL